MSTNGLVSYFKEGSTEERVYGKSVTDVALNSDLTTFAREIAQNVRDARQCGAVPKLRFFAEVLEGSDLHAFMDAIDWSHLRPHYESVAEEDEIIGVQRVLDQIDEGSLYVVGVEDLNTVGLEGAEDSRKTNFSSLIKDFGISTKTGYEGGIHGVGASVLWGFSGLKTVLFNTVPESPKSDRIPPRLLGRIDLPDHVLGGRTYKGDGWIGVDDTSGQFDRPISKWNVPADLAQRLCVDRPNSPGTTALVVGFREQIRSTRTPDELVDALYEKIAEYYWPLIVDGGIEVSVEGPSDGSPRAVDPHDVATVCPYVEAYEAATTADATLDGPGSVAAVSVEFEVPEREDGTPSKPGDLTLVVRLPTDADPDTHRNKMAMFRGARQVVKYRQYQAVSLTTSTEFYALLLAGGAKHDIDDLSTSWPDSDSVIEQFFRDAEPKAHDEWEEGTAKLETTYKSNPKKAIEDLLSNKVKTTLQKLLAKANSDDSNIVDAGSPYPYFDRGTIGSSQSGGSDGGGGGAPGFDELLSEGWFDGYNYKYKGTIDRAESPSGEWTINVKIVEVDGSNRAIDEIEVESIICSAATKATVDKGIAKLSFGASTKKATYELESVKVGDGTALLGGQTRLKFDYDFEG